MQLRFNRGQLCNFQPLQKKVQSQPLITFILDFMLLFTVAPFFPPKDELPTQR